MDKEIRPEDPVGGNDLAKEFNSAEGHGPEGGFDPIRDFRPLAGGGSADVYLTNPGRQAFSPAAPEIPSAPEPEEDQISDVEQLEEDVSREPERSGEPASGVKPEKKKKTPLHRALGVLGNIVFVLFLVILIFAVVTMTQNRSNDGKSGVSLFGYRMFTVQTGSMEPTYHTGSVVFVKEVPAKEIREGDPITFRAAGGTGSVVTHRVVAIEEAGGLLNFTTRGDANDAVDPEKTSSTHVYGVTQKFSIPLLGYILDFVRSGLGLIVVIIIPAVLIIVVELIKLIRFSKQPN